MSVVAKSETSRAPGILAVPLVSLYLLGTWLRLLLTRRLSFQGLWIFLKSAFQPREIRDVPYMVAEEGFCFVLPAPDGQVSDQEGVSRLELLEDNRPLPHPHTSFHGSIRSVGCGRYSHWGKWIYFSTPDNSSPLKNGRKYSVRCPKA
jgi:hypothetical protein